MKTNLSTNNINATTNTTKENLSLATQSSFITKLGKISHQYIFETILKLVDFFLLRNE